jgi:ADP-heptose:LPS heptosyltransferase
VGLVLGASTPVKAWPVEHFVRLVGMLREEGAEVVLIGGPAEAEREAAVQKELAAPALSVVGKTDLPRLAALLDRADAVVAGDTGALHLAAAVGTPVVGLYGPTSPEVTGPYGEQHRVLWDRPECGPCRNRPRCKDYHCMRDLTPERVAEAVGEVLGGRTYPAGRVALGTPPGTGGAE